MYPGNWHSQLVLATVTCNDRLTKDPQQFMLTVPYSHAVSAQLLDPGFTILTLFWAGKTFQLPRYLQKGSPTRHLASRTAMAHQSYNATQPTRLQSADHHHHHQHPDTSTIKSLIPFLPSYEPLQKHDKTLFPIDKQ